MYKQNERDNFTQVSYFVESRDQGFYCEIVLPEKSPIRGLIGDVATTKIQAKQSAAFDVCILLHRKKLLDDHFKSAYQKRLPAMRNAKLAIVSKKTNQYTVINKPSIWTRHQGETPESLYGLVFSFHPVQPLIREHGSFMLLTREQIPEIPVFPLYLEGNTETIIQTTALRGTLPVCSKDLLHLSEFMITIFSDIFHKTFELDSPKLPYWIAPLKTKIKEFDQAALPTDLIDWEAVNFVHENRELKWTKEKVADSLLNHFLFDPWDGRKRYFPLAVDCTLRPSDPVPSYLPRRRWMENILNYSLSLGKGSRRKWLEKAQWDQPVLRVQSICLRRNFLDKATSAEKGETGEVFVCPQPLNISAVSIALAHPI